MFQSNKRLSIVSLFLVMSAMVALFAGVSSMARATPGSPGTPEAPVIIYSEDFQNTPSLAPVNLASYTGAAGMTYSASTSWLTTCNGEILAFSTPNSAFTTSNCSVGNGGANSGTNLTGAFDQVRRMAYALGQLNSATDPAINKALTAYTDYGNLYANPGAGLIQLETRSPIVLPGSSRRFVISDVDTAAVNCAFTGTVQAKLVFYLLDGSDTRRINQTPINVCTDSAAQQFTPPALQTNGSGSLSSGVVQAARIHTDRALLTQTTSVGMRMVNEEGGGYGNDNALDNIQITDASPKLDKAFDPATVLVGETSRMTFTVTNTTDLLAKAGWSFTDSLPEGLLVAETPNVATTCSSGSITASGDRLQVSYSGNLDGGQTSCTLSIDVTSQIPATYTNGPSNIVSPVGLRLPADASVTFAPHVPSTGGVRNQTINYVVLGALTVIPALGIIKKFKHKRA